MAPVILAVGSGFRSAALRDSGFRVIDAADGPRLLSQAEYLPTRPSLVVLDIEFPGLDAFDVCARLKANPRTQPIAVLLVSDTAVSPEDGIRALTAGADWCLTEPNGAPFLIESVQALLRRRADQARIDWLANEDHLRQGQKMEAIGHLAFGVAHDFNNLLTAILGYTEMMLSQIGDDKPICADLNEIRKAGDRAAALTGQLLRFSRKQPMSIALVDLNLVVSEAEQMLERLIGEHIRLQTRLAADLWSIAADTTQLEQVLLNLVVNARDAIPASGGTVLIETTNVALSSPQEFDEVTVAPGRYTLLKVQDTGSGMNEATRVRLFEPYFTTKGRDRGTGLGLATVYGILKHLKGYIFAESSPDQGTTFRLYFPAAVELATTAPAPVARLNPSLGRETISWSRMTMPCAGTRRSRFVATVTTCSRPRPRPWRSRSCANIPR